MVLLGHVVLHLMPAGKHIKQVAISWRWFASFKLEIKKMNINNLEKKRKF